MYLDSLTPVFAEVGYGALGVRGDLGYSAARVTVAQRTYDHALSTHPPARVTFDLGGRFASFRCRVAMNDDVPRGRSHADFIVFADGRRVASAEYVLAGSPPRELVADVAGAGVIELAVRTTRWDYSHAVWIEPEVDEAPLAASVLFVDCLGRAEITLLPMPPVERCIATVVSPGFDTLLDDMLGSLVANGGCPEARLVVFAFNPDASCERVAAKYGTALVRCTARAFLGMASKALLYSVAHVVDARQYLCIDADMLVAGELAPVFTALDALPPRSILVCRESNREKFRNLDHALHGLYGGGGADVETLAITPEEAAYPLVVNDGLFAGSREALLALDGTIRAMPQAEPWMAATSWVWWRNQFIFNLALARLDAAVELDGAYNVQLRETDVAICNGTRRVAADWNGRPARVLHFNGEAKQKYPELRGRYSAVARPLAGPAPGDPYARFLAVLRAWIGTYGLDAMSWSFYGTTDGASAEVRDASVFPLLATLHYLIRSNGCIRVLESGTARGVSAACIASAIAHRQGARLVTFDPNPFAERADLWNALPADWRQCIEPRAIGAIEGMTASLEAGEQYEAALLDSLHTEEHVWAEFQLARRLVCPGGLILIHDALYALGTVEGALKRIEHDGYGVVRLWTAEGGVQEDDRLGLAVIENRRRSDGRHS
jgi:hypothetical protein